MGWILVWVWDGDDHVDEEEVAVGGADLGRAVHEVVCAQLHVGGHRRGREAEGDAHVPTVARRREGVGGGEGEPALDDAAVERHPLQLRLRRGALGQGERLVRQRHGRPLEIGAADREGRRRDRTGRARAARSGFWTRHMRDLDSGLVGEFVGKATSKQNRARRDPFFFIF